VRDPPARENELGLSAREIEREEIPWDQVVQGSGRVEEATVWRPAGEEKGLRCSDLDEPNTRWRIRRAVEKGRRGRWISLPPDLFAAVLATLPPREDRSPDGPVFPGLTQERLRTAIARACKASGTPTWSPHDLRHRRISLWHRQGETWALIGARVGQRSLSVTADTYTHVLLDDRELDHTRLASELRVTRV
jgi:integrase